MSDKKSKMYSLPNKIRKQVARKSTFIDMTPMVDLAFLLVTFFMLTVKFKAPETVEVLIPGSIAQNKAHPKDVINLTIGKDGRIFFGVDNRKVREQMITELNAQKRLGLTSEEIKAFIGMPDIGVPFKQVKSVINLPIEERGGKTQKGIPTDTLREKNELADWISAARRAGNGMGISLYISVKGDEKTPYPEADKVFKTLKMLNLNRFSLVTNEEVVPSNARLRNKPNK